jgi:3-phenylpropionate/trans-cinnamate dioxygenase ferredoxin component
VCAAHAATFDLTTGEPVGVLAVEPLRVYACRVEDGAVLVDLDRELGTDE